MRNAWAEDGGPGLLHEEGDEGAAGGGGPVGKQVLPAKDGQDGDGHAEIEGGDDRDGEEDGSRDGAAGVFDFTAEQGDVVVAPVVVGGEEHGGGETGEEGWSEVEGSAGKGDGLGDVSAEQARDDDGGERGEDDGKHGEREAADVGEVAKEQEDGEEDYGYGDGGRGAELDGSGDGAEVKGVKGGAPGERREEEGAVLRKADGGAGDRKGAGKEDLEQKKEGEDFAGSAGKDGAEVGVGSAGYGEGGTEFGPDEAVGEGNEGPEKPTQHGLGTSHGGDEQGQRDKGASADHVEQVERDSTAERNGAVEFVRRLDGFECTG